MPVIGHAFVGYATALCVRPTDSSARRSVGTVFWAPIVVGLAYLPDIANQLASLLGASDARVVTHSFLFGLVASLSVGFLLSWFCGIPWRRAAGVSLFSILTHDALDLLQATDRQPWWPFSRRTVGFGDGLIPLDPVHEVVLFGAAFLVFLGGFLLFGRLRKPLPYGRGSECSVGVRWVGRGALCVIILSACVTHYLRGVREMQYEEILVLLNENNFRGVLELAADLQQALVDVLESSSPVSWRLIVTERQPLEPAVAEGRILKRFFSLVSTLEISIPPLRERATDIAALVRHFLTRYRNYGTGGETVASDEFIEALKRTRLPGNARQIENIVREALVKQEHPGPLTLQHLSAEVLRETAALEINPPPPAPQQVPMRGISMTSSERIGRPDMSEPDLNDDELNLARQMAKYERWMVETAIRRTRGNQTRAARLLGITPRSVYTKIRKHGLVM